MFTRTPLVAIALVVMLACTVVPSGQAIAETPEEELARLREDNARLSTELNATLAKLEKAEKDRDAYDQRLEDSTYVLILALIMMCISWVIFWISARRQSAMLRALRAQFGTEDAPRPPRRRG